MHVVRTFRSAVSGRPEGLHYIRVENDLAVTAATVRSSSLNREPAIVMRVAGMIEAVYVATVDEGVISALRIVRNPDKLTYITRQLASYQ
jgi:hypothetical protein